MFWDNFKKICDERNESPNSVCKAIGLSNATSTHWKNGASPKGNTLKKVADYLGVSVNYLLGEERQSEYSESKPIAFIDESRDEEIQALKLAIEQKNAEIKRLNKLLDLTLRVQDDLEKKMKYLKDNGVDTNIPLD